MKIAIVGTRGIPNNYGGFETLVEYLVEYLARDFEITVFCSSRDMTTRQKKYRDANLKYIPVTSHGALGIIYDSVSLIHALSRYDKVLFLGFGGGFVMPFFSKYKKKIILNIGGLDWKRDKWSPIAKIIIKLAEKLLVKYSSHIISDNLGIQNYLMNEYGRSSFFIAYGGDQANKIPINEESVSNYPFLSSKYAFSVTRIQSDNNIEMILKAFMKLDKIPFVMVGNWNNSKYGNEIKNKYNNEKNLILLDAIYDRNKLDILRSNCTLYIHGHSAGGTNPSLTEAMYLGLPIYAFASGYNENTTFNKAKYFKNEDELTQLVNSYECIETKMMGEELKKLAEVNYRWSNIANEYKKIILIKE